MSIIRIRTCPYCGSEDIVPKVIFGGPMAGVDNKDGTYRCRSCGKLAVPLEFNDQEEHVSFRGVIMDQQGQEDAFKHIPILPVDTRALISIAGIDLPLGSVAEVVSVKWEKNELVRSDYSAKFTRYWKAVSGSRYNSPEIMLLDLAGMVNGKPHFDALRELLKRKYDVWLDIGIRDEGDLFDAFAMGVSYALAGTMYCSDQGIFKILFDLSDKCVPCIHYDNGVVWKRPGSGQADLGQMMDMLKEIGYEEAVIIDLPRLGTGTGFSQTVAEAALAHGMRVYFGGGITEKDLPALEALGFAGALIDPFTPVIEDIIRSTEQAVPAPVPGDLSVRTAAATKSSTNDLRT